MFFFGKTIFFVKTEVEYSRAFQKCAICHIYLQNYGYPVFLSTPCRLKDNTKGRRLNLTFRLSYFKSLRSSLQSHYL